MRRYLAKTDWNNTLHNKTAAEYRNILISEIDCIFEKCVSLSKQGNGKKQKYKQIMWKIYGHTGSGEDHAICKEAINQATAEIKTSKRSYEKNV